MTDNASSGVLKLSGKDELGTAYVKIFHQGEPRLLLANNADDKVIIPYDLLPESQQDCGVMVRVVDAVRHLVNTIRNLEAQRDWLASKLGDMCSVSSRGSCGVPEPCPYSKGYCRCLDVEQKEWVQVVKEAKC